MSQREQGSDNIYIREGLIDWILDWTTSVSLQVYHVYGFDRFSALRARTVHEITYAVVLLLRTYAWDMYGYFCIYYGPRSTPFFAQVKNALISLYLSFPFLQFY